MLAQQVRSDPVKPCASIHLSSTERGPTGERAHEHLAGQLVGYRRTSTTTHIPPDLIVVTVKQQPEHARIPDRVPNHLVIAAGSVLLVHQQPSTRLMTEARNLVHGPAIHPLLFCGNPLAVRPEECCNSNSAGEPRAFACGWVLRRRAVVGIGSSRSPIVHPK
jgi:hypothetical protein